MFCESFLAVNFIEVCDGLYGLTCSYPDEVVHAAVGWLVALLFVSVLPLSWLLVYLGCKKEKVVIISTEGPSTGFAPTNRRHLLGVVNGMD